MSCIQPVLLPDASIPSLYRKQALLQVMILRKSHGKWVVDLLCRPGRPFSARVPENSSYILPYILR